MMVVLTALLMIGVVGVVAAPGASATCTLSGAGDSGSPYLIGTASDMRQLGMETADGCGLAASYKLTGDIDMSAYGVWNGAGAYDAPTAGSGALAFTGSLDGDGHTLSNMTGSATDSYYGLFRRTSTGAVIKNVTIDNFKLDTALIDTGVASNGGPEKRGTLVGQHVTGLLTITGVRVTRGAVNGFQHIGGLVGDSWSSSGTLQLGGALTADRVSFSGSVQASNNAGGFFGAGSGVVNMTNALVDGSVTALGTTAGGKVAGGVAGTIKAGTIDRVTVRNTVDASASTGGRAGGFASTINSDASTAGSSSSLSRIDIASNVTGVEMAAGFSTYTTLYTDVTLDRISYRGNLTYAGASSSTASTYTGGLFAYIATGTASGLMLTIKDSYAYGHANVDKSANATVGGLIGKVSHSVTLGTIPSVAFDRAYSGMKLFSDGADDTRVRGAASSAQSTGGLVGAAFGGISPTYSANGGSFFRPNIGGNGSGVQMGAIGYQEAVGVVTGGVNLDSGQGRLPTDSFPAQWDIKASWQVGDNTNVWGRYLPLVNPPGVNEGYPYLLSQYDSDPQIPAAPLKPTVAPADGDATVTVAAGSGATPTSYTVTSSPELKTCTVTGAAGSCTVTGLTNSLAYTFTATATTGSGTSGSSVASDPAMPLLTPAVPQQPTVATLNASASVTVVPGAGGGAATKYVVTAYASSTPSGTCEILTSASPLACVVTPLTNGTAYTFKATAVNANTTASAASVASALITPVAAPNVPQAPTAVTLDASARVTVVPGAGGGAPVSYTVTAYAGGTASGTCPVLATASPLSCVVTGLTNGTAYTFKASATNANTTSAEGLASNSVTPIAAPTVPGQPSVQTRDASASVTVVPGAGGGAVTSYTVTSSPESKTCVVSNPGSSLTCTVVGLTNGTPYTFTATATNPNSTSAASAASASITPVALPSTPAAPTAMAGDARATVTVVLGSGGAEVSWLVTAVENGNTCTITAPATSCVVTGLVNALAYTFTAVATNATGSSGSSLASTSATPMITPPGVPGAPTAIAGDGLATVSVTAGSGGAASTYTVTATPGGATCTVTAPATSCVVRGLTNGTAYTFTAKATNDSGTSTSSSASGAVTPAAPAIAAIPPGASDVPGAAALTGGAALPPVPGAARCKSAMCKTKGVVPTGATKIMQTATSSTKKINGRCSMKAPKKGPKAYACKVRLKKGTWTITTQAMKGGVVIAQTVKTMQVR
jgi:hypothetical protein